MERLLVSVVIVALAGGCAWIRPARSPMASEAHAPLGPDRARGVVVLLPGLGDRPRVFVSRGFLAVLNQHAPAFDVVAADAHFGYYRTRTVLDELHRNVIGPLRARGYRQVWLAGASMGGHGAVAYARAYPGEIAGLLLFAPYLGPKQAVGEVVRAGGLCPWSPPAHFTADVVGFALENFAWLRATTCPPPARLPIFVGIGAKDGLLAPNQLLRAVLPPSSFLVLPGGHGWEVWTPALTALLPRAFPASPTPSSARAANPRSPPGAP
jgi:pimeloyl-ACP methyl ester carboxylesterase